MAAVLIFVLALTSVGRGFAASSAEIETAFGVPGVSTPICHSGPGDGSTPVDPTHHDCCDICALLAPATLADAPILTNPASVVHVVAHVGAMAWVPTLARLRTPRQSQGPPTA